MLPVFCPGGTVVIRYNVVLGMFPIVITLVQIDFFSHYLNAPGPTLKAMSKAAYTVFIVHPLFISLVQWSYVEILRARGTNVLANARSNATFVYAYFLIDGSEAHLWFGAAFMMLAVHATVWPVGYLIKRVLDTSCLGRIL